MEFRICPVCKNEFESVNNKIHCNINCYAKSKKLKQLSSNSYLILNNKEKKWHQGFIKENVGLSALHEWIQKYKPHTGFCEICEKSESDKTIIDAANISGEYRRDIDDFIWLCRSCHAKFDRIKKKYNVIGVESKRAKYLDAKEKRIATFLLDNNIFSKIYIAHPIKDGRKTKIVYQNFER